jgi:hypothetical protein
LIDLEKLERTRVNWMIQLIVQTSHMVAPMHSLNIHELSLILVDKSKIDFRSLDLGRIWFGSKYLHNYLASPPSIVQRLATLIPPIKSPVRQLLEFSLQEIVETNASIPMYSITLEKL